MPRSIFAVFHFRGIPTQYWAGVRCYLILEYLDDSNELCITFFLMSLFFFVSEYTRCFQRILFRFETVLPFKINVLPFECFSFTFMDATTLWGLDCFRDNYKFIT